MDETEGPSEPESFEELRGAVLRSVGLQLDRGAVELEIRSSQGEELRLHFEGVLSSTLLGPWDGHPARIEWLVRRSVAEQRCAFELRLLYPEVPRNYRIVARSVQLLRSS